MISPAIDSIIITLVITFLLEAAWRRHFRRPKQLKKRPRPVLSIGLILGITIMAGLGGSVYAEQGGGGWKLLCVVLGAMPLLYAGLRSDIARPSSRRHLLGTLLGGFLLIIAGLSIQVISLPGLGTHDIGLPASILLTLAWTFLVVSLLEICALLPLAAGGIALAIGAGIFTPLPLYETYAGFTLAGALLGGILGRSLAILMMTRSHPMEKSEVLVLGYTAAAATLATYMKSLTMTAFVLPVAVILIAIIMILTRSFDSSLILRPRPRE